MQQLCTNEIICKIEKIPVAACIHLSSLDPSLTRIFTHTVKTPTILMNQKLQIQVYNCFFLKETSIQQCMKALHLSTRLHRSINFNKQKKM